MSILSAKITCYAAAKLNLFLHILDKRADGYHNLQSIFTLISYFDVLTFGIRCDKRINRTGNTTISSGNDLSIKAAKLLQQHNKNSFGVNIDIVKKIPIGSGLGGGSSDAATTLLALNKLWQLNFSKAKLKKIAKQLGADVPFFVHNHSAWIEGIGDKISSINLPKYYFLVVSLKQKLSTSAVFKHPLLNHSKSISKDQILQILDKTGNDCLDASIAICSEIKQIFIWMQQLPKHVNNWQSHQVKHLLKPRLSGTGASVFIALNAKAPLLEAQKICPPKWRCFVAENINTSQPCLLSG